VLKTAPQELKNGINHNGHTENGSESFDSKLLLQILTEVKNGNFAVRMPVDETGSTERFTIHSTRSYLLMKI